MVNGIGCRRQRETTAVKIFMDILSKHPAMSVNTKYNSGVIPPIPKKVLKAMLNKGTGSVKPKKHNMSLGVATWNAADRYSGDSEMRWKGCGMCTVDDYQVLYVGNKGAAHDNRVAVILSKSLAKSIVATKSSEDENEALSLVKKADNTIVMGDFNANVGKEQCQNIVGGFGMGRKNDRGDRLIQFCQDNDLFITNTFFKLHQRRLYTWTSNAETEDMNGGNQIDFILVKQRFRSSIKSAKTYPGAAIGSAHNPLVARTHIRLKQILKKQSQNSIDRTLLRKEPIRSIVREQLHKYLETHNENATDSDTQWNKIRTDISNLCQKHLKSKTQNKKRPWMTDEILDLVGFSGGTQIILEVKASYLASQCKEIGDLEATYDSFNMYKKIMEATDHSRSNRASGVLCDKSGKIVQRLQQKLIERTNYITELFDDRIATPALQDTEGPQIYMQRC
ncbi:uncharacterized protein LOC125503792 [Dendroctonus ponderosae]|uniref:uncharacterized protein LOC125503792 n=1 Tax=Dendroctonus ponderosae TaxID=77166 RepID=UPI002034D40D|nr:uncharacterized protein LOC125503792 [Dendroctonus ponderosae]